MIRKTYFTKLDIYKTHAPKAVQGDYIYKCDSVLQNCDWICGDTSVN